MKWSLLLPTRGRREGFRRLQTSLLETLCDSDGNISPEKKMDIQFVVRRDEDDLMSHGLTVWSPFHLLALTGPRARTSDLYNECAAAATGDLLMLVADDMEFKTPGWDKIIEDRLPADGIFCAWPHDGHKGLCTFPIVSRKWYETLGYFLPPCLEHAYVDTWLGNIAEWLGREIYVPEVLCEHHHFSLGKSEMDENYAWRRRDNLERIREDQKTYFENGELRQMAADKLRGLIR